uniref:Decapping nuclease n=1 Tax=Phytophthora ramorum TaxID=164328 RepID=H3GL78_PHYRM
MTEKRRRCDGDGDRQLTQRPRCSDRGVSAPRTASDPRSFTVPRVHELSRQERVSLSKPQEVAYFSKYADDDVRFDRSNLVGAKLLDGFEEYTSKDEMNPLSPPAPIGPLLAALEHFQGEERTREQPHFVTYRNNLNKIMGTPYNSKNDWTFDVEKRGGESTDDGKGDNQRKVNEDEEFCSISAMTLGDKRLVVAAEIDCYDDKGAAREGGREYIELKTFRLLQREKDQFVFERFKLLAFWIQSFLVGTPKIVCAFRNDEFEVRKLQSFRVTEIPNFCRKHWSPVVCLNFTKALLDWIYAHAEDGRVYRITYIPRRHVVDMTLSSEPSFLPV